MNGYPGAVIYPSPNFRANRRAAIDHVVFHTTELDLDDSLRVLTDPDRTAVNDEGEIERARVSAHYLVTPDRIFQLVDEGDEAWHARSANRHTIGIEVVGETEDPLTWSNKINNQLAQLVAWISSTHGIPLDYQDESTDAHADTQTPPAAARGFVSHAALDPSRRRDPGIWFPWTEIKAKAMQIQAGAAPSPSEAPAVLAVLIIAIGLAWALR
jgi:N-acetyl-anhydromuramyl-L-alanine amidase AmpD